MSDDKLWNQIIEEDEALGRQVRIEDDAIILNAGFEYPIELSRCDTHEKVLAWVAHLSEKLWITPAILHRFIYLAAQRHGLSINLA